MSIIEAIKNGEAAIVNYLDSQNITDSDIHSLTSYQKIVNSSLIKESLKSAKKKMKRISFSEIDLEKAENSILVSLFNKTTFENKKMIIQELSLRQSQNRFKGLSLINLLKKANDVELVRLLTKEQKRDYRFSKEFGSLSIVKNFDNFYFWQKSQIYDVAILCMRDFKECFSLWDTHSDKIKECFHFFDITIVKSTLNSFSERNFISTILVYDYILFHISNLENKEKEYDLFEQNDLVELAKSTQKKEYVVLLKNALKKYNQ